MSRSVHVAVAIKMLTVTSCSGSGTADRAAPTGVDLPASVSAEALLSPSSQFASQPITLTIEGEYANFSKRCSQTKALIGAVGYPRQVVAFDEAGRRRIPSSIPGPDDDCPLRLTSIQTELRTGNGSPLARGAAHIGARSGRQDLQCFVSTMGPGTCIEVRPESMGVREANKVRLIGNLTIQWR